MLDDASCALGTSKFASTSTAAGTASSTNSISNGKVVGQQSSRVTVIAATSHTTRAQHFPQPTFKSSSSTSTMAAAVMPGSSSTTSGNVRLIKTEVICEGDDGADMFVDGEYEENEIDEDELQAIGRLDTTELFNWTPDRPTQVRIHNVACSFQVPCHIDLRKLALKSVNVEYDSVKNVLLKQKRWPFCKARIYNTGKVIIIGNSSVEDARSAAIGVGLMIRRALGRAGMGICNYRVSNIQATAHLPFGVNIEQLPAALPDEQLNYEAEISAGLTWQLKEPKVSVTVHHTGSLVLMGAKDRAALEAAVAYIYPLVLPHRSDERYRPGKGFYGRKYIPPPLARAHHERRLCRPRPVGKRRCYIEREREAKQEAIEKLRAIREREKRRLAEAEAKAAAQPPPKVSRRDERVTYVGVGGDDQSDDDEEDDDFEDV